MTVVGIGTDLVDLDRFRQVLARTPSIVDRLFTESEQAYAKERRDPTEPLGVRFAAKEAALKALGLGLGSVGFREIEVIRAESGAPSLLLHGGAAEAARRSRGGSLDADAQPHQPSGSGGGDGRDAGRRMIPVVTPEEMNAIDRAAPEPVEVLIETGRCRGRARRRSTCWAVRTVVGWSCSPARATTATMGAVPRVGFGHAVFVSRSSTPRSHAPRYPACDLLIDAAYGTGFRGTYRAPEPAGADVLAVDIPSGVDGLTGVASDRVLAADRTITFAALKPGHLLAAGAELCGEIDIADIGLDVSSANGHLVTEQDFGSWYPDVCRRGPQVAAGRVCHRRESRSRRRGRAHCTRRAPRRRRLRPLERSGRRSARGQAARSSRRRAPGDGLGRRRVG